MKPHVNNVEFSSSLPNLEVQKEIVQRVVQSRTFSTSETLRSFLLYVAEHSRAENFEALKEQQIGSEVLGRRHDYNPAEDNIVRVRARQLRQRLDEYFSSEAVDEPFVISIPKGHYVLAFNPRAIPAPPPAAVPDEATGETNRPPAALASPTPRFPLRLVLPWTIAALAIAILAWQLSHDQAPVSGAQQRTAAAVDRGLWTPFFASTGREITVVTADSGVALWQDIAGKALTLGDYISRRYIQEPIGTSAMREIAARRYTSPADVGISLRIAEIAMSLGGHVKVQFARAIDIHDIRSGSLVLLGSRRSNPWVELFESKMNFVLDVSAGSNGPRFRNRSPQPGEPASYDIAGTYLVVQGAENKATDSYAVAALLPNSTEGSRVLVLEGLNMEGTEAAAEFVTNREKFGVFLQKIGVRDGSRLKSFEVLLKLVAVGGGYANPELVAYRYTTQ